MDGWEREGQVERYIEGWMDGWMGERGTGREIV